MGSTFFGLVDMGLLGPPGLISYFILFRDAREISNFMKHPLFNGVAELPLFNVDYMPSNAVAATTF